MRHCACFRSMCLSSQHSRCDASARCAACSSRASTTTRSRWSLRWWPTRNSAADSRTCRCNAASSRARARTHPPCVCPTGRTRRRCCFRGSASSNSEAAASSPMLGSRRSPPRRRRRSHGCASRSTRCCAGHGLHSRTSITARLPSVQTSPTRLCTTSVRAVRSSPSSAFGVVRRCARRLCAAQA